MFFLLIYRHQFKHIFVALKIVFSLESDGTNNKYNQCTHSDCTISIDYDQGGAFWQLKIFVFDDTSTSHICITKKIICKGQVHK